MAAKRTSARPNGSAPSERNHSRLPTAVETFALKEVKCLLIEVRSSSMSSRNLESRCGPSAMTPSTTSATAFSHGVISSRVPSPISRSATCSWPRPPHVERSVVTGLAV
jgi:hypothetical protein